MKLQPELILAALIAGAHKITRMAGQFKAAYQALPDEQRVLLKGALVVVTAAAFPGRMSVKLGAAGSLWSALQKLG